jgi:DNA mismatch repair ATPase MutS
VLAAGSLEVCLVGAEHHMQIDAATIEALELVQPLAIGSSGRKGMTLFKLLNGTRTKAGAAVLRANLLQPVRSIPTLKLRYDALGELHADSELFCTLDGCLGLLPTSLDT